MAGVAFLLAVPCLAHGLYSWMGFSPTDDGFILAYSRRILDGQVPHRDFISIRPVGSALVHAPVVLLGGEATLWLSRLAVWFQFACVAWVWTGIILRLLGLRMGVAQRVLLALAATMLSSHNFPMMAWHTADAIFLSTLGVALGMRDPMWAKVGGSVLLGLACLCKQNFVMMVPIALLLLGEWRRVWLWVSAAAPAACYLAFLLAAGAAPDAWAQMRSQEGMLGVAFVQYAATWFFPGGILLGWVAAWLARRAAPFLSVAGALVQCGIPVFFMAAIAKGMHFSEPAFLLFGAVVGAALCDMLRRRVARLRVAGLLLGLGWTASISFGYQSPVLVAGPLGVLLICAAIDTLGAASPMAPVGRFRALLPLAAAAAIALPYHTVRREQVYLDRPARELTERLDGVFPGAARLHTNPNTHAALVDLRAAIARTGGKRYAIVPDFAGYWVKARERNPLPIDWPQGTELSSPRVLQRVLDCLEAQRGQIVVIVQKFDARFLNLGIEPLADPGRFRVAHYVRERFIKIGDTPFFELYE
jgi:hypothetical protein